MRALLAALREPSSVAFALALCSALAGLAAGIAKLSPNPGPLGSAPFIIFIAHTFRVELMAFGFLCLALLLSHGAMHRNIYLKHLLSRSATNGNQTLLGISQHERLLWRRVLTVALLISVTAIVGSCWNWIRYTGILVRDERIVPLYRKYVFASALDAEAHGQLELAIERFESFSEKFPDRVHANGIDDRVETLRHRLEAAKALDRRADELTKQRGFAQDIMHMRLIAYYANPANARLLEKLNSAISAGESFSRVAILTAQRCAAQSDALDPTQRGQTLVALGITDGNRVIAADQAKGAAIDVCSLVGSMKPTELEVNLRRRWQLDVIKGYSQLVESAIREPDYDSTKPYAFREISDDDQTEDDIYRIVDPSSMYPVSFHIRKNAALDRQNDPIELDVFADPMIGIALCWRNAGRLTNLLIGGTSRYTVTQAGVCGQLNREGQIPRIQYSRDLSTASQLANALSKLVVSLEKGERVSGLPADQVRHNICRALVHVTNFTMNSADNDWGVYCQSELLAYGRQWASKSIDRE